MHSPYLVLTLLTLLSFLAGPCLSTNIISPSQFITGQLTTPRMDIGNSTRTFNFTAALAATDTSLCDISDITNEEKEYFSGILFYFFYFKDGVWLKLTKKPNELLEKIQQ